MDTVSLTFIYFIYGLAFFAMGLAVLLEVGRTSDLRFARSLPWLSAFGLIHGSHEWVEMFEVMGHLPAEWPMGSFRLVALIVSFACLATFGISLGRAESASGKTAMWRALALIGTSLGGLVVLRFWFPPSEWIATASVWARYSLGVVGSSITSSALVSQGRSFAQRGTARFGRDMMWAAIAFALYGVVGQMFVPATRLPPSNVINSDLFLRLFGVPVQLFRGLMAVVVAIAIIRALRIFETERSQQLQAAQATALEAERRVQRETFQLNKQLQEAINELSILYEMSRVLAITLNWQVLLHQAAAKVVDLLPAQAAMILLDTPTSATVGACAGFNSEDQKGQWARAYSAGQHAMAAQTTSPDVYIEDGMLAVPLHAKRGLIGSLVICADDIHTFESRRSLLLTLGRELGAAIENAQLYQRVQEREELRGDLLRKSVEVQEEERKRIARELHDGIGQIFTALALGLSGVEETMPRDPNVAREQVGNLKNLSIRAITEMRQLVADLRPPQLDDLGLVPALHWLAEEWRGRLPLDAHVQVEGHRRRLTPEMETELFRIAQEGITNIAKHARAQRASIRLTFDTDSVTLLVEDDGVGMTPEQISRPLSRHQGWGLVGIQERAALVGGEFTIDSRPGQGTRLTVHIPLVEQEVVA
jgi:signal transduction histidine kinase